MILYLVRHATPNCKEYEGFPGPPLGEAGRKEAKRIALFLGEKPIEKIYTSDYIRVLETLNPYRINHQEVPTEIIIPLRERENKMETHESLVQRVHQWFESISPSLKGQTIIFSHCGPINMILEYLDKHKTILTYPYECPYLCLTPKGGIWQLEIEKGQLKNGELFTQSDL